MKKNVLSNRRALLIAGVSVLLVAALASTGCGVQKDTGSGTPPATQQGTGSLEQKNANTAEKQVIAEGEALTIPVSDISETARFYPVNINGTDMEVLAVKAPDGTIRTAFNTCEVCYDSGAGYYVQDGTDLVCQNCQNRFATGAVEVSASGCNPYPIFSENKTVDDASITIDYDYLVTTTQVFANWKTQF